MISVICPYNDKKTLEMLLNSIKKQKYEDYELILVDSKELKFKSASQALNYGASLANGDLLVFCHQDIEFESPDDFDKIVEFSNENEFGIAGVAGKKDGDLYCTTSVTIGPNKIPGGRNTTECVMETSTLDECLFIVKRKGFKGITDLGDTWHFYSVEYCLKCRENKEKVLLFPINIYHLSPGYSMNLNYYDTLQKVAKKHKNIKTISTTCGTFKNDKFLKIRCWYYKAKLIAKKIMKKR